MEEEEEVPLDERVNYQTLALDQSDLIFPIISTPLL